MHGDIDVIFSPRCAVASVTGLIRDVQEIFLIKSRATHVQPIHPNLIPLLISIGIGKIICFENLYCLDCIPFSSLFIDFLLEERQIFSNG